MVTSVDSTNHRYSNLICNCECISQTLCSVCHFFSPWIKISSSHQSNRHRAGWWSRNNESAKKIRKKNILDTFNIFWMYSVVFTMLTFKIQGVSYWNGWNLMALRGRRSNNFVELWCLVASGGVDIWVSSTSFQKSNIGWPQQPPKERVPDISKKLDFWWFILQKGTSFDHLGARDDLTIRISNFFDEMRLLRSLRPLRLLRL